MSTDPNSFRENSNANMPICLYVYNINTILNEKLFQLTYLQESGIFADTGSLNSTMILRSPPR